MKFSLTFLLSVSLVANAVLLFRTRTVEAPRAAAPIKPPAPKAAPRTMLDEALWQKASSGDTTALQAIRDSRLPPELVRALLRAAIVERFREREKALYPSVKDLKYWSASYTNSFYTPKDRVALLDLRREREALFDQWTPGWRQNEDDENPIAGVISADKARQAKLIDEDFSALIGNTRNSNFMVSGIVLPGNREKLQFLEKERRSELAQLLTPEELQEYDLRNSRTASSLRYNLSPFNPTEGEFREIFQIQKTTVDDKYPSGYDTQTSDLRSARGKAQEEANAQIKAILGEQRYADYTRSQDQDYRAFTAIADRLQLPADRAAEAYRVKTDLEKKFEAKPASPTPEATAALLATLTQEADREFTRVLGAKGYEVYKEYGELPRRVKMYLNRPKPVPKG